MRNTVLVGMEESHVLLPESTYAGMYSGHATSCVILVAICRDASGCVTRVGMAHVDAFAEAAALDRFFEAVPHAEVTLIGGTFERASFAMRAADRAGARIVFADAGTDSDTVTDPKAVAVDRDGNIYSGPREDMDEILQGRALRLADQVLPCVARGQLWPCPMPVAFH